jgi:hypothetical protein
MIVVHEALWLGDVMENSLINPNQCRIFGISMCDDPFDPHRQIGIHDPKTDITIPFKMFGTIVGLETRTPSLTEIQNCRHLVLCDDAPWDPYGVVLPDPDNPKAMTEEMKVASIKNTNQQQEVDYNPQLATMSSYITCPKEYANRCSSTINIRIDAVNSASRHSNITAEDLAKKWHVGLETARQTLKVTTQYGVRYSQQLMGQRFRTDIFHLNHNYLQTRMYTDTLFSKVLSIRGNKCAQIFCNEDFIKVVSMSSKSHAGRALKDLIDDVGVPTQIVADGAAELTKENTEFMQTVRRYHINLRHTEPYTPRQNFAERMIKELKRKWRHRMVIRSIPTRLWDYGLEYVAEIMSRTARGREGRTGIERLTGNSVDISEWLDFEFYDIVWYWDGPNRTDENPKLGRWLGIAHRIGSNMCYWVLNEKGNSLARTTVQHVTLLEQQNIDIRNKISEFTTRLVQQLDDTNFIDAPDHQIQFLQDEDVSEDELEQNNAVEHDDYTYDAYDELVGAQIIREYDGQRVRGRVTKRSCNDVGTPIGTKDKVTLFDTRQYEVQMEDGTIAEYCDNSDVL